MTCAYGHVARTAKLRNTAKNNNLDKPLHSPSYNSTRWVQYAFDLLNTTLRNWRSAIVYFITENEPLLAECWLSYDRLHLLTFLTDVLSLLKTFQKFFESDTNTILELSKKSRSSSNAWKFAFIKRKWLGRTFFKWDGIWRWRRVFYGHKLINERRTRNVSNYAYISEKREAIIRSLLTHLNERFECDEITQECLKPLHPITITSSTDSLQLCHEFVVPDFDKTLFIAEYRHVADSLKNHEFKSPLDTLQTLYQHSPDSFFIVKATLARLAAAKPHSADVERFISNSLDKLLLLFF